MALTEQQHRTRSQGVGGSDAVKLLTGDWYDLWAEKLGMKERDDLSDILPVQMGIYTEDFNRNWFEKTTGKLVLTSNETIVSPTFSWMVASLDGWIEEEQAVWEAKHVNGFSKPDNVLKKYMPQLQHYMMVTGATKAYLSVLYGNYKHEVTEVEADPAYQIELIELESKFWNCVQKRIDPTTIDIADMELTDEPNTQEEVVGISQE